MQKTLTILKIGFVFFTNNVTTSDLKVKCDLDISSRDLTQRIFPLCNTDLIIV